MAGGKSRQSSKEARGKEKMTSRALFNDDQDEEMFDAEAHDLGDDQTTSSTPLDDQTRDESRDESELPSLDPTTLWFNDLKVRSAVSGAITGYYRAPWRNFGEVPAATKEHWWNLFSAQFRWAPQINELLKLTFRRRVATRLRDMFHTITHKMNGAKRSWMSEEIHKEMMNIVATDPTYKARSAQNKKNRRGGSMEKPVQGTHFQGSLSVVQHAKRMAAKNKGQLSTAPELFLKKHFKELPGKGTVPVNPTAKEIAEAYQKRVEEASTQRIQKSPNELYWETVGGRNKKGRVKGLGGSADLYYGSQMVRLSTSSMQYTPSLVSQMQDQMETRVQALREEMELEMQARVQASVRAQMEEMEKRLEERMMSRYPNDTCSTVRPPFCDPMDDDPGSGGAGQGTPVVA
ncbi:uncharacterized protein LOC110712081 [Chenopodium quinoa]|uniref:uncharacterized protein LOC110712081 n=1 Tax=Chenopodium quinoa TaxID=63459 RepID=UPI000B792A73|nr:uncharacterized protein LOC110712081 [Chenopodium quinoa]